jgi:hypothetical protein
MRRLLAALSLLSLLAGCETAPIGGRCLYNSDCDRNTTGMTARCASGQNPANPCSPGASNYCLCCPIVINPNDLSLPMGCRNGTVADAEVPTEAGPSDAMADGEPGDAIADVATDVSTDANDVVEAGPSCACAAGQFCDTADGGMQCVAQRTIGAACGNSIECQTGHCVEGVCCNSACTGSGLSCNLSPDFAGLCMAVPTTDAGTE